ncbi:hypothetical protein [Pedobacter frigoris]|uniref:hypothetical protein n=1 Tax=Pedobacter frigoris TaxID=2571272 RepID=UPI00292CC0C6|nr:hypothetical protein [Pedobacter frigoris]
MNLQFRIAFIWFSMLRVLLTIYLSSKGYRLFLFMWAIILLLLNLVHVGETIYKEASDLSQVGLLSFVAVANILLVLDIRKWRSIEV